MQANEEFDVDGNLVRQSRCLAAAYDTSNVRHSEHHAPQNQTSEEEVVSVQTFFNAVPKMGVRELVFEGSVALKGRNPTFRRSR